MFDYAAALAGCARGNRVALRQLYDAEAGRLISVAQRIVRRRDLAEEAVHDAFMHIWQKAAMFDPARGSARAWIYTVVRNRALNIVRDGARTDLMAPEELAAASDHRTVIGDAFDRLADDSLLRRCLEQIEREKRDCVLLSYVGGYSHGEVAGLLGVPLGTAKSWIRRGLEALKECMS